MAKNCAYCGQSFEGRGRGIYCSRSHRELAYRQRKGIPLTPFKGGQLSLETAQLYETKIAQVQKELEQIKKQNEAFRRLVNEVVPIVIECEKTTVDAQLRLRAQTFLNRFKK